MKKLSVLLLLLCFLAVSTAAQAAPDFAPGQARGLDKGEAGTYEYMLVVNGRTLNINKTKIFEDDGDVLLPVRDVLQGLRFQVRWFGRDRTITAHRMDEDLFTFSLTDYDLVMVKGRTYIPLEALRDLLDDQDVDYDLDILEDTLLWRGKRSRTVATIVLSGGLAPWQGSGVPPDGDDDDDDKDKDEMTGWITERLDPEELRGELDLDEEEWDEWLEGEDAGDVLGALELDDEILFLVNEDTELTDSEDEERPFADYAVGTRVHVRYDPEQVSADPELYLAERVMLLHKTMSGRITAKLDLEELKEALEWEEVDWDAFCAAWDLDDFLGVLELDEEHLVLFDEDRTELVQDDQEIDYEDLSVGDRVLVTWCQRELEDDPEVRLALVVDRLEESVEGIIETVYTDPADARVLLGMDESEWEEFLDDASLEAFAALIRLEDDGWYLIDEDETDVMDEADESLDPQLLAQGQTVRISHAAEPLTESPDVHLARTVVLLEMETGGTVVGVNDDPDLISVLVEVDAERTVLFLMDEDTEVPEAPELGEEVTVRHVATPLELPLEAYLALRLDVTEE